jgi:hypothetical protein
VAGLDIDGSAHNVLPIFRTIMGIGREGENGDVRLLMGKGKDAGATAVMFAG